MLVVGVLVLVVLAAVEPRARPTEGRKTVEPSARSTDGRETEHLPFDLPSAQALRDTDKLVLAHYFPPLPVSLDNEEPDEDYYAQEYLDPEGEGGKHEDYGGYLRDRPLPRDPIDDEDWRRLDMRTEVRQAIAGGLDGFTVNIIQLEDGSDPRLWRNTVALMEAAHDVDPDFAVVLMPDMSGSLAEQDVEAVAAGMARLAAEPSAHRLPDGRLLVAPFKAEAHTVDWWQSFLDEMEDEHDLPVALLPTFVDDERDLVDDYAEISYGLSVWGARNPDANDPDRRDARSGRRRAERVHDLDVAWMQPVSVQDQRPGQGVYEEAENTRNLRATWRLARETGAKLVQIPTWNDYTEGTHIAPSVMHGWTFLDVSAYYLTWYKTGSAPKIVRDAVYVTHRTQPVDAEPELEQDELMRRRSGSDARDTVEALTFLTRPATVEIRVGDESHSCDVDAGVDTCVVPLSVGTVSAEVMRDGDTVTSVTSPYEVTDEPYVQDLQYVGVSSLREPPEQTALRP